MPRKPTQRQLEYWALLKKRCRQCGYTVRKHCPFERGLSCSYYCNKFHHEFKEQK